MSNALWIGVLIGVLVGAFASEWVKIGAFVVALVFSDLVQKASHGVHGVHTAIPPWMIGVGGVIFGLMSWHFGRKRGLQHLGQAELRTRWRNVRRISKWGW